MNISLVLAAGALTTSHAPSAVIQAASCVTPIILEPGHVPLRMEGIHASRVGTLLVGQVYTEQVRVTVKPRHTRVNHFERPVHLVNMCFDHQH